MCCRMDILVLYNIFLLLIYIFAPTIICFYMAAMLFYVAWKQILLLANFAWYAILPYESTFKFWVIKRGIHILQCGKYPVLSWQPRHLSTFIALYYHIHSMNVPNCILITSQIFLKGECEPLRLLMAVDWLYQSRVTNKVAQLNKYTNSPQTAEWYGRALVQITWWVSYAAFVPWFCNFVCIKVTHPSRQPARHGMAARQSVVITSQHHFYLISPSGSIEISVYNEPCMDCPMTSSESKYLIQGYAKNIGHRWWIAVGPDQKNCKVGFWVLRLEVHVGCSRQMYAIHNK